MRMRRSPVFLLLAVLPLPSCGEVEAAGPATTPLSLEWNGTPAAPTTRLARVPLPDAWPADGGGGWVALAGEAALVGDGDAAAFHLHGSQSLRALVPAGEDLPRASLVALDVSSDDPVRVRVGLGHVGEEGAPRLRTARDVVALNRGERARLEFEIEPLPTDTHLVVSAHCKFRAGLTVHGVELLHTPIERRLAAIDEDPRWITLAGESRPAHAVAPRRDVACTFAVPPRGRMHLGWAPPAETPGGPGRLTVSVLPVAGLAAKERLVAELPLDAAARVWREARVDLGDWAGETVRLRLAVEGAPLALVTRPLLVVPRRDPPAVLLVSSDTHRADHVGCAPDAAPVRTPALDRLARQGVLFERAFASSNITLPSHVTLMTGTNPRDTGVLDNLTRLDGRAVTLAERFRDEGWATYAAVSARHLDPRKSGLGQGFERVGVPGDIERSGAEAIAELRGWVDDAGDRPLFLWLHLFDAHRPYDPADEAVRASYPAHRDDAFDPGLPDPDFPGLREARGARDAEWIRALYRAQIDELDAELAALLDHPRLRQAVVVFTSDHGENLGESGLWWDHMGAFPSVLRVPLILRWPGGPRGRRVTRTVAQADVGRTLLDLAGISPGDFPGDDLRAWLASTPPERPRFAIAGNAHSYAVTAENWHLTITLHNGAKVELMTSDNAGENPVQLFDLDRDPACERDLSEDEPERVAALGRALLEWLGEPRRSLAVEEVASDEDRALIEELGYAADEDPVPGADRLDPGRVRAVLQPYLADG